MSRLQIAKDIKAPSREEVKGETWSESIIFNQSHVKELEKRSLFPKKRPANDSYASAKQDYQRQNKTKNGNNRYATIVSKKEKQPELVMHPRKYAQGNFQPQLPVHGQYNHSRSGSVKSAQGSTKSSNRSLHINHPQMLNKQSHSRCPIRMMHPQTPANGSVSSMQSIESGMLGSGKITPSHTPITSNKRNKEEPLNDIRGPHSRTYREYRHRQDMTRNMAMQHDISMNMNFFNPHTNFYNPYYAMSNPYYQIPMMNIHPNYTPIMNSVLYHH